jgi:hypothetical protein
VPTYDASTAACLIYTFKDGLFAKLAHDLKLSAQSLSVTVDEAGLAVSATIDTRNIHVLCFRKDGQDDPGGIGTFERGQIEGNLHKDVLASASFPEARFVSTAVTASSDGYTVRGSLSLHGHTVELTVPVRRSGDRLLATVPLRQTAFGIKPYSAALGALKVRDEVTVTLSVPAR